MFLIGLIVLAIGIVFFADAQNKIEYRKGILLSTFGFSLMVLVAIIF